MLLEILQGQGIKIMSLCLTQSHALACRQKLLLSQTQAIQVPLNLIDLAIDRVVSNPDSVSATIESMQGHNGNGGNAVNVYGYVLQNLIGKEKSHDESASPVREKTFLTGLESLTVSQSAKPDVEFVGVGEFENRSIYADHLSPKRRLELVELPKKVAPFYSWLLRERNWISDTLKKIYEHARKEQSAFIFTLDPGRLTHLTHERIGRHSEIGYHESTISRLLIGRNVAITSPNRNVKSLPVSFLFPSAAAILAYNQIPLINGLLEEEARRCQAYSSEEISDTIGRLARRTVTKHLSQANVPNKFVRQREYESGRKEPFKISLGIEPYIEGAEK